MPEFIIGILVGIVILSSFVDARDDYQSRQYCEMTQIYQDTNGEFGWPNYRDDIECINGEVK
jgi:hypothetical protein